MERRQRFRAAGLLAQQCWGDKIRPVASRLHVDKLHSRREAQAFFLESKSSLGTASSLAAMMKSFSVSPLRECVHSSTFSRFQFCAGSALLQPPTQAVSVVRSQGSRLIVLSRIPGLLTASPPRRWSRSSLSQAVLL